MTLSGTPSVDAGADEAFLVESPPGTATNARALRQMVSEHLEFVWRVLRRLGVYPADVDDATQQVLLIASQKFDRIQPGSERSFLVAIAVRVASHTRRSYQRRKNFEQRFSENPPEATPNPEELTQRLQARELLDRALEDMPLDLRAVFVLFELEELSVDAVAALLSLPRGTVATRLRRARETFHEQAKRLAATTRANGGAK